MEDRKKIILKALSLFSSEDVDIDIFSNMEAYQKLGDLEKCRELEETIDEEKEGRRKMGMEIADGG